MEARAVDASIHVYNKTKSATGSVVSRAALCVVATFDRQGVPSILFEAAGPHPVTPDRFNWSDKVTFMVDQDEIQQVLCVLLGYLEEEGIDAAGAVGESDPAQAIDDALATFAADRIVIFSHPEGDRDYREDQSLADAETRWNLPVTHALISR